jgi:hypothetical protein
LSHSGIVEFAWHHYGRYVGGIDRCDAARSDAVAVTLTLQ